MAITNTLYGLIHNRIAMKTAQIVQFLGDSAAAVTGNHIYTVTIAIRVTILKPFPEQLPN